MHRSSRVVPFLGVLALALSSAAHAATLEGRVRAKDGAALPQVVLSVTGPAGVRTVVSGPDGRFTARELAPGDYVLATETPGLVLEGERVTLTEQAPARVDVVLTPLALREQVLVSATRSPALASTLGSSTTALDRTRIEERESKDLVHLLEEVPGVSVSRAGGMGRQASAFVRGGESRFARVLVDGVPVNEPGGLHGFGTQLPLELEQIEVVRGAASSLYGSDALAGVIHLVTRRAATGEAPGMRAEAEGGEMAWRRFALGAAGQRNRFDWNAGGQRLTTDNEGANSRFETTAAALSAGLALGEGTAARLVTRYETSDGGTPGQTAYGRPDLDASYGREDLTVSAHVRMVRGTAAHEVRLGLARTDQLSLNPQDSGPFLPRAGERVGSFEFFDFSSPEGFRNDTRRQFASYQAEVQVGARHLFTGGLDLERETGTLGRVPEIIEPTRENGGAFVQDRVALGSRAFLTVGGRVEQNESYGTAVVPRAALAFRVKGGSNATTLRASAGAGIKEPTFFESFGASFFAKGNPDLEPERSRTFDLGVEQRLLTGRLRVEATAFHHRYLQQIAYQVLDYTTFEGSYLNLGETRARGVEVALTAAPTRLLQVSGQYTLMDGEIVTSGNAFDPVYAAGRGLLRRPRHRGSVTARVGDPRFSAAVTVISVGRRTDSDFLGLGLEEAEGYTRVDGRVHARVTHAVEAFAVAENLLDRQYQEVLGYPALPRALRAGVRLRAGGARRP